MRADAAHTEVSSLVTLAGGKAAQGLETQPEKVPPSHRAPGIRAFLYSSQRVL